MIKITETSIWQEYEYGLSYQRNMEFNEKFPIYEKFKNGDQWPEPTKRTANLPRPVFNIVDFFVRTKKSAVLNQTIRLNFKPTETKEEDLERATKGASDFTDFTRNLWEKIDQDRLNDDFVEDAATLGTGILHYYWESSDINMRNNKSYFGELRGETIDPLNIFFGNPQEEDVQKQPYIIISSRVSASKVTEFAKEMGLTEYNFEGDNDVSNEGYDTTKFENKADGKITVLTKYYRENGEVVFSKSTKTKILCEGVPLTPRNNLKDEDTEDGFAMTLYPIIVFTWKRRKKSIFGAGEVEGIIPNQKAINFNIAMMLLSVQQCAWPKILSKTGAIRQQITNMPGEIITDYYAGGGDGIKYMQPPNISYIGVNLTERIFELSRVTSGVTEIATGENFSSNISAAAIIAMQNQAKAPIDNIQKRFYRAIKEIGKIFEQFYKAYFIVPQNIIVRDEKGDENIRCFIGEEYSDIDFSLSVDVGAVGTYSESLSLSMLDKLYDRNEITLDEYLELAPPNAVPFKEELKSMRRR